MPTQCIVTSAIAAKPTVINEVYVFSIKYRYSDNFIEKYIHFIYSTDVTFLGPELQCLLKVKEDLS